MGSIVVAACLLLLVWIWWQRRRYRLAEARRQTTTNDVSEVTPSTRLIQDNPSPVTIPAVLTPSFSSGFDASRFGPAYSSPFISNSRSRVRDAAPARSALPYLTHEHAESRVSVDLPNPYDQPHEAFNTSRTSRDLPSAPEEVVIRPASTASTALSSMSLLAHGSSAATSTSKRISVLHEELTVHQKNLEARIARELAESRVPDPPPTYRDFEAGGTSSA